MTTVVPQSHILTPYVGVATRLESESATLTMSLFAKKTTEHQSMAELLQENLRTMRKEKSCTDFEIHIDDQVFPCHKVVLAAVSDYFKAMFNSRMVETKENNMTLQDIKPETFQSVLDIVYHKDWEPDGSIMSDLLQAAGMLQITFIEKKCVDFFQTNMRPNNCVEIWKMSKSLQCAILQKNCWTFMIDNFTALVKENVLYTLDYDELSSIINDENLDVKEEDVICRLVFDWVSLDSEKRNVHFRDMLKWCNLIKLTDHFLYEELVFHPSVRADDECSGMVRDAVRYKLHPSSRESFPYRFRKADKLEFATMLIGMTETPTNAVADTKENLKVETLCYIKRTNEWFRWECFYGVEAGFACCAHGDSIYITGGGGKRPSSSTFQFIGKDNHWEKKEDMPVELTRHTITSTDKFLYVLGGKLAFEYSTHVIRYDVSEDNWDIVGDLVAPVEQASSVALGHSIYVFGGLIGDSPADCIQAFDTRTGTCDILCHLPSPAAFTRAVGLRDRAYVVTSVGDVLEIHENSSDTKTLTTIPNFKRSFFGLSLDPENKSKLLITGGAKEEDEIDDEFDEAGLSSKHDNTKFKSDDASFSMDQTPTTQSEIGLFDRPPRKRASSVDGGQTKKKVLFNDVITVDIDSGRTTSSSVLPRPYKIYGYAHLVIQTPDKRLRQQKKVGKLTSKKKSMPCS